jgi:murein DD-endopeptidase MepM/ murein hydrolase activator NlpD
LLDNTFDEAGNAQSPPGADARDPKGFGIHVALRHADGRVSWMLHMQPGSVLVSIGEHVRVGTPIGKIGFTGDSLFPHLHYTVTDAVSYPSQGVPSYFKDFSRILGSRSVRIKTGQVDTGDLLESNNACR